MAEFKLLLLLECPDLGGQHLDWKLQQIGYATCVSFEIETVAPFPFLLLKFNSRVNFLHSAPGQSGSALKTCSRGSDTLLMP